MTRVVGVDPGTVSIDVCGLMDGRLYLDRSWSTEEALARPEGFIEFLTTSGVPDLVAGPSGYGLPLLQSIHVTEDDLRLARPRIRTTMAPRGIREVPCVAQPVLAIASTLFVRLFGHPLRTTVLGRLRRRPGVPERAPAGLG